MIRRLGLFRMLCRVDWGLVRGGGSCLLGRVGGEDADVAVEELDTTLTLQFWLGGNRVFMCDDFLIPMYICIGRHSE